MTFRRVTDALEAQTPPSHIVLHQVPPVTLVRGLDATKHKYSFHAWTDSTVIASGFFVAYNTIRSELD